MDQYSSITNLKYMLENDIRGAIDHSGLEVQRFRVLICINENPNCSASFIAEQTGMHGPAISRILANLVDSDYIEIGNVRGDNRVASISATKIGCKIFRKYIKEYRSAASNYTAIAYAISRAVESIKYERK